jgi:hypothetical protein
LQETHFQAQRVLQSKMMSNVGRDRQLTQEQTFDIITKRPKLVEQLPPEQLRQSRTLGSGTNYNILSEPAAPIPVEHLTDLGRSHRESRPLTNYAPSLVRRRAVDLLSNQYVEKNEERLERDASVARERALTRYWQTRSLNTVTQTYVDPLKEATYQAHLQSAVAVQGLAHTARLPPSIATSLGESYNIVAHCEKPGAALELVDTMAARPLRRLMRRHDHEAAGSAGGEAAAQAEERRSLSRYSRRRHVEGYDPHAFNILTGAESDPAGMDRSFAGQATMRATTPWERISGDLQAPAHGRRSGTAPASSSQSWSHPGDDS